MAPPQDHAERHPRVGQHMPKGAPDIEVVFGAMLQQQRNPEITCETQAGDGHDPFAIDGNRLEKTFHAYDRDADRREQQHERTQ